MTECKVFVWERVTECKVFVWERVTECKVFVCCGIVAHHVQYLSTCNELKRLCI